MTFSEWVKKNKKDEKEEATTLPTPSNGSQNGSTAQGKTSFSEWLTTRKANSLDDWASSSYVLVNDISNRASTWFDEAEYQSQYEKVSNLLAQADSWRKQYAGNTEAISYIDSVVSALEHGKNASATYYNHYSKWKTADDYNTSVKWQKKFADIEAEARKREQEKLNFNTIAGEKEIAELEGLLKEWENLSKTATTAIKDPTTGKYTDDFLRYREINEMYGGGDGLEELINDKKKYLNEAKTAQEKKRKADYYSQIKNASDFAYYSAQGAAIKNPTVDDVEFTYFWEDAAEVGNIVTYSRENANDLIAANINGQATKGQYIYRNMTDDEVNIYNYLLAKFGKEKGEEFLSFIQENLNAREGKDVADSLMGIDIPVVEQLAIGAFGLAAGVDQFVGGVSQLFTDEKRPTSSMQYANAEIANSLDGIAKYAYTATNVIGNMAPSILVSSLTGGMGAPALLAQGAGAFTMGVSAAGNAYGSALADGYSEGQARSYGVLVGLSESTLQYLIGGICNLGGVGTQKILNKVAMIDQSLLRVSAKIGVDTLFEIMEEEAQLWLEPLFRKIIFGEDYDAPTIDEMVETAIVTAMTTPVLGGYSTIREDINENRKLTGAGEDVMGIDGGLDKLKKLSNEVAGVSTGKVQKNLAKLTSKVSDKASPRKVGMLYNAVNAAIGTQNHADIVKTLTRGENAFTEKKASEIAGALIAQANGLELTSKQSKLLESVRRNSNVQQVLDEVINNPNSAMNQRKLQMREFNNDIAINAIKQVITKQVTEKEFTPEGIYDTSSESKAIRTDTQEEIDIKGVKEISKGKLVLELSDGQTIDAKDVSFGNEADALIYEAVAKIGDNIDATSANQLIAQYKGGDAMVFARGIAQAYTYGFYRLDKSELFSQYSLADKLTDEQRDFAYELGEKYRPVKDAIDKTEASKKMAESGKTTAEKGVYYRDKDGNATDISTYLKESNIKLNDLQKSGIEMMRKMSEMMGVRFNVFETWVEDGKRYYLNENGEVVEGNPNGFYDTVTGEIYIDLNAGNNYQGTMLFTIAHEVTHFMRQWSPEHFTKIAEIVFQHGGMKGNISELVALKQAKAEAKGKSISYDVALEEVVADGMETILKDGKVVQFMADVKQKDYTGWKKLKGWFMKLANFLRSYIGHTAQTVEGAKVAEFSQDLLNQIEQIYAEGAVASGENYQEAVDSYRAAQEQFSTANMQGNADGAVVQSEATTALVEATSKNQMRTELEAMPKQVMSLSDGAGTILHSIEGLTPTKIEGISGKTVNGYTGRDVRAWAMKVAGFTQAQINEVNKFMDSMAEFMEEAGVTYKFIGLQDVKDAKLHYTYNPDGSIKSIVLSAMVKNGDYPVNFDLSSICKKRTAMSKLIDKLAKRGSLDNGTVKLTPSNIFKINTALKNAGYETACLGCFVESKRYNSLEWATKFCNKWNAAVKKVNPNATYFGYGDATFNEDSFTLEQAIKVDDAATKYITATKTERLANALKKYQAKAEAGLPLVEGKVMQVGGEELNTFSKAARDRLIKSDTISDELKTKYLTCDVSTLNMADVEFLLENGILPGASLSNKQAVTEMVKSGEAYQHLLRPSDLLTDRGISKLEALPNFHGVLYGHYGSGTPKLMQSYTPYNSEIALLPSKKGDQSLAEYLYTIAGVRMQSFSDFQIQNIYDYLQMVGDLAARKVPAHAYTKEISFAKLLGMTGIKVNLSVMFDIDPMVDKAHAGLTKLNKLVHRGEYAKVVLEDAQGKWVYNIGDYQTQRMFAEAFPNEAKRFLQSIGFADAVKLQTSAGYSANCGIIGVGYSDLGIFAMLGDNRIRYIIPYHASSLPADIKVATNIELGTDYTPYQNNMKISSIVDRNGNKVNWTIKEAYKRLGSGQAVINELNEKIRKEGWVVKTTKAQTGHGSYGLYEDLQQTNDPRHTASNFMDWCIGNNTLPLFYQFASHENYYKLLYDYNVYDCVTEEYAPQQAVTNTYPTMVDGQVQPSNVTDGGFNTEYLQGTIDKQMAFMDEYSRNLDEDLDALAENMEEGNYTLFSDRDATETTRFSPRDTSAVPEDISNFVDTALTDRKSDQQMEITVATALDNKAIHRLGAQFNGHYDGSARTMTSRYIRHIINNHGDPIIEALRGQLHMDGDAIKIALSKLQSGAGRVVGKGESIRGNPTILTEIPINGYTLYAEEPVEQLSGTDLEGRTMFMTPTSTKALIPTRSANIPQRRSEGHKVIIDGKKRIVNSFLADASGNVADVNYIELNGSPYAGGKTQFLVAMCNDADVLLKCAPKGATIGKANVAVNNPYIVTPQNPVFTAEDFDNGLVPDRAREIMDLGYDAIIMDYNPGDNYMVMAFDKKSVVKLSDRDSDSTRFALREAVEETKDLLAYHNITAKLLLDALNRNSLLMPSLAITNKGMTDFGDISLLFDKNTIDPESGEQNKLYGADAWTPTQTELKMNAKFDTDKTVRAVNTIKNRIGSKYESALFNVTAKQFKDAIIKADGSIYDAYAHNIGMQTAYAMEKGIISKIPTKNGMVDKAALQEQLNAELDTDNGWRQYKRWLNNISDTVITSYDAATNEDILRNMKSQPASAKTFKLTENGELVVPAVEYTSIDEARKNKHRLSENAAEATKAVADEFMALAKSIGNTKTVVNAINTAFTNRYSTADIVKSFKQSGIDISTETASQIQELYKKAVELPTQYFEAKPHREVGLDEVKAVVLPDSSDMAEVKSKLEAMGIPVIQYKAGSNESRVEALNSQEGLKFSDRDFLAEDQLKGNYSVSEISEMFDAWNSDASTAELAKKVFARLQKTQDNLSRHGVTPGLYSKPYPIRFLSGKYMRDIFYHDPKGMFGGKQHEKSYGLAYNLDYFRSASDQDKAHVLLHEAIHACTVGVIQSVEARLPKNADPLAFNSVDGWSDIQKAGLELLQAFEQVRFANKQNEYGQKNVYEMVAEMSNPEFRTMLKKQSLWGRIVDAIKRIFGVEQRTAYDAVSDALDRILEIDNVRFQERSEDSASNRSLLANALEGAAKNEIELNKIQEYKSKIDLINAEEQKLHELNEQIKELSFSKGPRDTQKIRDLRDEATMTANRISTYDKQLLRLEASKPLQDVLQREKKMAYDRAIKKGKEEMVAYKEKTAKTQRELLDRWKESRKKAVESRGRTVMRHKVQSVVGELNQLLLNEDKKRHVPDSLKKAVADALALVNMDTVGAEERAAKYAALIAKETDPDKIDAYTMTMENILRQGEKMGQRLKELRDAYEDIQNSDDPDIANGYDPVISASLKELSESIGNTSLRDMSSEQLSDVYDMYRMVLTRVRDANKSLIESIKETITNRASRVVGEVRRAGGEHKYRASVLDPVRSFFWNNAKPVYAMEHIGSPALTEAYNNVRKGEDTWAKDVTDARAYYIDKSKKYGYDSWDFKTKYTFESASGLEFDLTLEQIMSLYAYSKRDQAHDHLRLGGFVFDSNIETYKDKGSKLLKYKVNTADAHQITPEILADITGTLTKEQIAFVDEMQEYLSKVMGAKGNEVTMKMYGVKLFKEMFYFPLKSAKQFMFEQNEVSGEVRIKNSGFTNKTKPQANNPVILNNFMDVWANHVNDMSMYHSFVLPLEDFNRIFNYNSPKQEGVPPVSVKGTIQSAYSPAAVSYVKQLITDLNGGAIADPRENFSKSWVARFKKAKVFSSLSVVVQQPSAIGRAFALVNPKYFHPTKDGMNHDALWAELKQYAPVAIIKEMGYFDTNMGKSTLDFIKAKEYTTFKEKAKAIFADSNYRDEKLSRLPALADELTWCAIWNAVKRETVATHKDLRPGSEEFLKAAGERFTEVVTKTQVYDSVLARSANMRSKGGLMSMITSFMAEPTTSINMLEDAMRKRKRGYKGYAAKAFASVATSAILNNALVALVYGMRDDDEDETFAEKYMQAFTSGMMDDVNPITYYPFVKDMWSVLQGYDVERSDMSLVSDLADAMKSMVQAYTSEDGDVSGAWWTIADAIANIGGIPMQNIRRDVNGAINFFNTIIEDVNGRATTWGSMGDALETAFKDTMPVVGWFPGDTKADNLYDAIISGDKDYVNRLKGSYKDEDAYHNAVRKALRDNDPRIKEAAVAGFNGDPSERVRIAKLIIADGFVQDDVVAAINAEINAMKPDDSSSGTKAKGYYTSEDFAVEIANGDQFAANAIKADVIQTLQKNGKTAEEAEKSFKSSAKNELKELYLAGKISKDKVINALTTYCGSEQEDAESDIQYWDFRQDYPDVFIDDAWVDEYYNEVESSGISLDVFIDYRNKVKGITGEGKKESRMAIIDSLPITSAQKDALYLAEGWTASRLYEAPWH